MCSKTMALNVHVKRISTFLTTFQLMGFAPLLFWLLKQNHNMWSIVGLYIVVFIHYVLNNILYHGTTHKSGRNGYVLTWLVYHTIEYVGLFVFGVYSAFCVLTWPARGWPEYYIFDPAVLSGISLGIATMNVVCWIVVLKFYVMPANPKKPVVEINASSKEDSKDENILNFHKNKNGKDNGGFNVSEDEWSNDVIMEIGQKVWNKPSPSQDSEHFLDNSIEGTDSGRLFISP